MGSMAQNDAGPSHTFAHGNTSRSPSKGSDDTCPPISPTTFLLPTTRMSPPLTTNTTLADLSGGAKVKMMWEVVEQMVVKGFVVLDLYVTVEPAIVEVGESSQHTILDGTVDEHINSIPLQSYQRCVENIGDGDNFEELLDTMGEHKDVDHIEDVVVEENRDTCFGPDPMPEWFTKNT
nr:hypothetical protein CFP56_45924 [Quercus suber]